MYVKADETSTTKTTVLTEFVVEVLIVAHEQASFEHVLLATVALIYCYITIWY